MRQQQYMEDQRGVTPVVGVVLLVALVTIIAASVGTYVTGTFDQNVTPVPSVGFVTEYDGGTLTIGHESGDAFEGQEVHFKRVSGSGDPLPATWGTDTVRAGEHVELTGIAPDDVILVVWEEPAKGGKTAVLYTWRGRDA